jgi:hypothetical protein
MHIHVRIAMQHATIYWYGEERRNRVCEDTTRGEIGD